MIRIIFEKTHDTYGVFRDALYLPEDHAFTDIELEDMKQQRFDNWIAAIIAPPSEEV